MPSLNNCLENGPNLIESIPDVMLCFREGHYSVVADIAKAFLQIATKPEDYLQFLWYNSENEIIVLGHKRVVFGVKCTPFLLGAVIDVHLQRLLENCIVAPEVIERLHNSFYVDNVSTSDDTMDELDQFIECSHKVMSDGKFDLQGWSTSAYVENENKSFIVNVMILNRDLKLHVLVVKNAQRNFICLI